MAGIMDLNAPPEDDDDAEEGAEGEEDADEAENFEAEEDADEEVEAEEEEVGDAYGEIAKNVEAEVEEEEEEPAEEPPKQERYELGVEIMRREREERKRKMQLIRQREESTQDRAPKVPKASTSSTPKAEIPRPRPVISLPEGWLDCPSSGEPIFRLVPSKVPLGEYFNEGIEAGKRYSFRHALRQQRAAKRDIALVIDLTNTTRYYSSSEVEKQGVKHVKIPCKGRNEVPDNESVNKFFYEASRFFSGMRKDNGCILVHCTHGFNRTGYMIIHYLMRTQRHLTVEQGLQIFARSRPPGIYKRDYIQKLYAFYHERRPEPLECPSTPEWKRPLDLNGEARDNDDDDDDGVDGVAEEPTKQDVPMTIDDVLGDPVPFEQQLEMQRFCVQKLGLKTHGTMSFPGSQPVSLDRKHLQLLRQRYYYATWKADGTRYMMLITFDGCYLIDRKFNFRRVQMRFPQRLKPGQPKEPTDNHHLTLLDGEMVIDKDPGTGAQTRRYLVYDLMVLNNTSLVKEVRFCDRWKSIETELIEPRKMDAAYNRRYNYDSELFRVRRKDFWLLSTTEKLLHEFIPKRLTHEADGLIFQGWEDEYVPRTHQGLLKWKYAHMNSVDFLLKYSPERNKYCLYLLDRGTHRVLDGANVSFPGHLNPADFDNKIIECSWNPTDQVWEVMRERTDKEHANAFNTYEKVMASIHDNITEDVLFEEIKQILQLPMYKEKIQRDQQMMQARRR